MHRPPASPTIVVTGATGFLGTAIVRQLCELNCRVRSSGRKMPPPIELPNYSPVDICDRSAVTRLVEGADIVIHAAGLAHQHRASASDAATFFRINVTGTEEVVRSAAAAGCGRVVLVSSVAVYGSGWPRKTEAAVCTPTTPYAQSKWEAENVAADIAISAGLELITLRMATLYGDNDPGNVGRLLQAIDRGRFVWIGRGENQKTLVHVDDAARACVIAATCPELPRHRTYNVADEPRSMRAIVSELTAALGRRTPALHLPPSVALTFASLAGKVPLLRERMGRVRSTLEKWLGHEAYDAARFRDSFDWCARVAFPEGIARQVAQFRKPVFRSPSS